MESILLSVKSYIGGAVTETEYFDDQIIDHINSVFADLWQLGIGPREDFMIEDDIPTWDDFLRGSTKLNAVKTYVELRVKLLFDPPTIASVLESMQRQVDKWEWRLTVAAESKY